MKRPAKQGLFLLGLSILLIATGCQQAVMGMTISLPPTSPIPETALPVFPTLEPDYSPNVISPPLDMPTVPTVTFKQSPLSTATRSNQPGTTWTALPLPTVSVPYSPPLPTTAPPAAATVSSSGPGQVTGLTAVANGTDAIKLAWNRVQAEDILCYVVYRSTSSGGPYTPIAWPGARDTSYTNNALEYGTVYYYCVSAVDMGNREGKLSDEASAVNFSLASIPVVLEIFSRQN